MNDEKNATENQHAADGAGRSSKRAYRKPELVEFGKIDELTLSALGSCPDAGRTSQVGGC